MLLKSSWRWWSMLDCEMLNSPDTHWMPLTGYGLEHCLKIHTFRPCWPCLIIEIFAAWAKFLTRLVTVLLHSFHNNKSFWLLLWCYVSVWTHKTSPYLQLFLQLPKSKKILKIIFYFILKNDVWLVLIQSKCMMETNLFAPFIINYCSHPVYGF